MSWKSFFQGIVDIATRSKIPDEVLGFAITGRHQAPSRRRRSEDQRRSRSTYRERHHGDQIAEEVLIESFDEMFSEILDSIQDREELKRDAESYIDGHLEAYNVHNSQYADYYRERLMEHLERLDFFSCFFRAQAFGDCDCGDETCEFSMVA